MPVVTVNLSPPSIGETEIPPSEMTGGFLRLSGLLLGLDKGLVSRVTLLYPMGRKTMSNTYQPRWTAEEIIAVRNAMQDTIGGLLDDARTAASANNYTHETEILGRIAPLSSALTSLKAVTLKTKCKNPNCKSDLPDDAHTCIHCGAFQDIVTVADRVSMFGNVVELKHRARGRQKGELGVVEGHEPFDVLVRFVSTPDQVTPMSPHSLRTKVY